MENYTHFTLVSCTTTQIKAAVHTFIQNHETLEDALENVFQDSNTQKEKRGKKWAGLLVKTRQILEQLESLLTQIQKKVVHVNDNDFIDLELCVVLLLQFRAALLRSKAISYLCSSLEEEGRTKHGPEAIRAYEELILFSDGYYLSANDLYQLGWLHLTIGQKNEALRYFKLLLNKFPDDKDFCGPTSLRIMEIESQSLHNSYSGFCFKNLAYNHIQSGGKVILSEWHLPLQCMQYATSWLLNEMGFNMSRSTIQGAMGRILASNESIIKSFRSLGITARPVMRAQFVSSCNDINLLIVTPGKTPWLTHALSAIRRSSTWHFLDPGNIQSKILIDVDENEISYILNTAIISLTLYTP